MKKVLLAIIGAMVISGSTAAVTAMVTYHWTLNNITVETDGKNTSGALIDTPLYKGYYYECIN